MKILQLGGMISGWDEDTAAGTDDFWLGLDRVNLLTTSGSYRLRLEWQETTTNYWFSIEYWTFYIDDEAQGYKLHVSGYIHGDDGRAMCVQNKYFLRILQGYNGIRSAVFFVNSAKIQPRSYYTGFPDL